MFENVAHDRNIVTTEAWKIERYQELAFQVGRIHHVEVVVVPLVKKGPLEQSRKSLRSGRST